MYIPFINKISFKFFIAIACCVMSIGSIIGQTTSSNFGQNRVQFHDFEWSFYETEHFDVYYYIGGQDLGKFVIFDAEQEYKDVMQLLDLRLRSKISILVYTDITDVNMTNIGIRQDIKNVGGTIPILDNKMLLYFDGNHNHLREQIREGLARIYTEQMAQGVSAQQVLQRSVVPDLPQWYTNGLVQYISKGWTPEDDDKLRMGIKSKRFKKFKRLSAEDANFIGKAFWNYVVSVYGKDAMANLLYITRINPKNLDNAFMYALNNGINESLNKSMKFYTKRFENIELNSTPILKSKLLPIPTKEKTDYYSLTINDKGNKIAYASNFLGRQKLYIFDLSTQKKKVILRNGFKTNTLLTDHSYPLLAWEPGGKKLSVMFENRDNIKLMQYDVDKNKKSIKPVTKFQKVFSMSYGSDRGTLLLSAEQKGQCDIFSYQINNTNTTQITNDFWDDLDPHYISTDAYRGIVFTSNRRSDTIRSGRMDIDLPLGPMNLFFYSPIESASYYAQITDNSTWATVGSVQNYSSNFISYVNNESGISNRYIAKFESSFWYNAKTYYISDSINENSDSITLPEATPIDSFIEDMTGINIDSVHIFPVYKLKGFPYAISNQFNSIAEQSFCFEKLKSAELYFNGKKFEFYLNDLDTNFREKDEFLLSKINYNIPEKDSQATDDVSIVTEEYLSAIDHSESQSYIDSFIDTNKTLFFQTEFDDWNDTSSMNVSITQYSATYSTPDAAPKPGNGYKFSKNRPYLVKLMIHNVGFQLDNKLLITRYAPFNPSNPSFLPQNIGGLINVEVTDLMENYHITGGFRIPLISTPASEYYLSYDNLKNRLDKKITYYRSVYNQIQKDDNKVPFDTIVLKEENLPLRYSIKTNYAEILLKYPFDVLQGLRFGFAFRNDKYIYKATNEQSLRLSNYATNWLSFKIEYVYDNTFDLATNLREGTRFRFFTELHKEIPTKDTKITKSFSAKLPRWNNAYFGIIGADIRHYQKLYKNIIFAARLSWSSSFGTKKMIYYLGGVEGGIFPRFNQTTPINVNNNYAFQSLATDLRGFNQNIRNGNSVVLVNAEFRIPVFTTFSNVTLRSQFLRNFQLVAFCDIGTAWEGISPFNKDNPLYQNVIRDPFNSPVIVRIYQYRNPIVAGFGPGLRTSIFGYFTRLDLAWGYDGNKITSPKVHLSFNLDF